MNASHQRAPLDGVGANQLAKNMLYRAVEVLNRRRPIRQLDHMFDRGVRDQLAALASVPSRSPYLLRKVHSSQPTPTSVEVNATINHGRRTRAVAARIEVRDGRWQCVEFALIGAHTAIRERSHGIRDAA